LEHFRGGARPFISNSQPFHSPGNSDDGLEAVPHKRDLQVQRRDPEAMGRKPEKL